MRTRMRARMDVAEGNNEDMGASVCASAAGGRDALHGFAKNATLSSYGHETMGGR